MSEPPRTSPTAWPAPAPGGDRDLLEPVSGGDVHRAGHVGVQRQPRHLGAGLLGRGNDAVGARPPQLALGLLERRLRDDRDVRPQLARRHPQARRSRRARTARARASARGQGRCEESRGPRCRPLSELLRRGERRQRAHRRSRQDALASAALPVPPRSHSSRTATTSSWPWRSDSARSERAPSAGAGPGRAWSASRATCASASVRLGENVHQRACQTAAACWKESGVSSSTARQITSASSSGRRRMACRDQPWSGALVRGRIRGSGLWAMDLRDRPCGQR
jgi:hypothetical protein